MLNLHMVVFQVFPGWNKFSLLFVISLGMRVRLNKSHLMYGYFWMVIICFQCCYITSESCSCWSIERNGAVQWKAGKYAAVIRNGPWATKEEIEWRPCSGNSTGEMSNFPLLKLWRDINFVVVLQCLAFMPFLSCHVITPENGFTTAASCCNISVKYRGIDEISSLKYAWKVTASVEV